MKTANMVKVTIEKSQDFSATVIVLSDSYYQVHYRRANINTLTEWYAFDELCAFVAERGSNYVFVEGLVNGLSSLGTSVLVLLASQREFKVWGNTPNAYARYMRASKGGREPSVLQRYLHVHVDIPVDYTAKIAFAVGRRIIELAAKVASSSSPEEVDFARSQLRRLVGGEA